MLENIGRDEHVIVRGQGIPIEHVAVSAMNVTHMLRGLGSGGRVQFHPVHYQRGTGLQEL